MISGMTRTRVPIPPAYSWESQARQYPPTRPPGISYFGGELSFGTVDCLLCYGEDCKLIGILNHYPFTVFPHEEKGNVSIWVHPQHQRLGIATKLLDAARKRWAINLDNQKYTEQGTKFINAYEKKPKT